MCVQINRRHEACIILVSKEARLHVVTDAHMTELDVYESGSGRKITEGQSKLRAQLTHPIVINDRVSVNADTSSSSSIVQVSLVECCRGISKVVTTYFSPLSFPSKRPHVSRFFAVLTDAIERKRGRTSRGNWTVLRTRESSSFFSVLEAGAMRGAASTGGDDRGRVGRGS